jgi:hypothetical protein
MLTLGLEVRKCAVTESGIAGSETGTPTVLAVPAGAFCVALALDLAGVPVAALGAQQMNSRHVESKHNRHWDKAFAQILSLSVASKRLTCRAGRGLGRTWRRLAALLFGDLK